MQFISQNKPIKILSVIFIISTVALGLLAYTAYYIKQGMETISYLDNSSQQNQVAQSPDLTALAEKPDNTQPSVKATGTQETQSSQNLFAYQNTLEDYRDHRLQIDNCVAYPTYFTVKNGTKVMVDNRS